MWRRGPGAGRPWGRSDGAGRHYRLPPGPKGAAVGTGLGMRLPDCQPNPNDSIVSRGPAAAARSPAGSPTRTTRSGAQECGAPRRGRITAPVSTSRGLPLPRGDEAATRPASIHRAMVLGLSPVRRATAAGVWSAGGVRPHERQRSSPSQSAASRPEPQRQQALTGRPGRGPASSG